MPKWVLHDDHICTVRHENFGWLYFFAREVVSVHKKTHIVQTSRAIRVQIHIHNFHGDRSKFGCSSVQMVVEHHSTESKLFHTTVPRRYVFAISPCGNIWPLRVIPRKEPCRHDHRSAQTGRTPNSREIAATIVEFLVCWMCLPPLIPCDELFYSLLQRRRRRISKLLFGKVDRGICHRHLSVRNCILDFRRFVQLKFDVPDKFRNQQRLIVAQVEWLEAPFTSSVLHSCLNPQNNVVYIGKVTKHLALVENGKVLPLRNSLCKYEWGHVRPPPRSINSKKAQANRAYVPQIEVCQSDNFIHEFGCAIEIGRPIQ
mmetsp:Transcript_35434/g.55171  ORF Transcript_35434/g.55171 Transcript_35434/m.55171 type:complete len:315 (-) Transcript_35434:472-1416(-)